MEKIFRDALMGVLLRADYRIAELEDEVALLQADLVAAYRGNVSTAAAEIIDVEFEEVSEG
jgi:hypothetical protein